MKKYKLIKEYPGSPELNTIVDENIREHCTFYTYTKGHKKEVIPHRYVKFSEFWEEVVKKDYEILSFIATKWCKGDRYQTIRKPDEDYTVDDFLYKGACVQSGDYQIHSIKRLSDGEIFTIGDEIGVSGFSFPIVSFKIHNEENTILVSAYRDKNRNGLYNTRLKNIQKVKKPLFTTKDGVDIFEGDKCVTVILDNFRIGNLSWKPDLNHLAPYENKGYMKVFSTKEKAEEYILLNKPCLSYNEVLNAAKIRNKNTFDSLKDLIKSKINLENA